jgi:adenylosuccinate lyase
MPYKRNPMRAERICALTRHVITLGLDPAFTAATQWMERTLDDSANRRLSIPDAYLTLDGALVLAENVSAGLIVNPAVVAKNLDEHLPFMATETLLMQATAGGGDRQELHERIRVHAHAAAREMKEGRVSDLVERIAADDAFGMDEGRIRGLIDAAAFVGRAPQQVDRFLEQHVDPVLSRLGPGAEARLGEPDVRV